MEFGRTRRAAGFIPAGGTVRIRRGAFPCHGRVAFVATEYSVHMDNMNIRILTSPVTYEPIPYDSRRLLPLRERPTETLAGSDVSYSCSICGLGRVWRKRPRLDAPDSSESVVPPRVSGGAACGPGPPFAQVSMAR